MGLPTEKKILRKAEAGNGPYDGDNNDVKGSWLVQVMMLLRCINSTCCHQSSCMIGLIVSNETLRQIYTPKAGQDVRNMPHRRPRICLRTPLPIERSTSFVSRTWCVVRAVTNCNEEPNSPLFAYTVDCHLLRSQYFILRSAFA